MNEVVLKADRARGVRMEDLGPGAPLAIDTTLKTELVYQRRFATRKEAREAIFEFIEVFYNRQRRHSSLGYVSPMEYEMKFEEEKRTRETKRAA